MASKAPDLFPRRNKEENMVNYSFFFQQAHFTEKLNTRTTLLPFAANVSLWCSAP